MNAAFLLLTVATGGGPPSELELAKAAAAAELAKLSLHAPKVGPATAENAYQRVYARVLAGERVTFTAPLDGFTGEPGEWVGYLKNGEPVMDRKAVSAIGAAPFVGTSGSTAGINAQRAAGISTPSAGTTPTAPTITLAPTTGRLGGTSNCPPGFFSSGST